MLKLSGQKGVGYFNKQRISLVIKNIYINYYMYQKCADTWYMNVVPYIVQVR